MATWASPGLMGWWVLGPMEGIGMQEKASPITFFPSSLTSTRPSWTAPTSDIPT